ncbi:META domain-containing protein [Euzebya tangerina]|uniref:META domain-containing protein n=1 Tax=Euzebya tangerina TaxID=591198 RepID=UPI00196B7DB7|nr:META domain-containing protein [Euzebya tangerina]
MPSLTVLALLLSACASRAGEVSSTGSAEDTSTSTEAAAAAPLTADDLMGRTLEATTVQGYEMVDGTGITMTFEDERVAVMAGCNVIRFAWSVDQDGQVSLTNGSMTRRGCAEPLMAQDRWLMDLLAGEGLTWETDGDALVIAGAEASLVLQDGA